MIMIFYAIACRISRYEADGDFFVVLSLLDVLLALVMLPLIFAAIVF